MRSQAKLGSEIWTKMMHVTREGKCFEAVSFVKLTTLALDLVG